MDFAGLCFSVLDYKIPRQGLHVFFLKILFMHLDTVKYINNYLYFPAKFQKTPMHIQRLWKADISLGVKIWILAYFWKY